MQSLHDSLNAAVEDVGDVLEQDVSRAGFLCQAYDFEEKARLLSLQAASSSEIADIRARKPGGDDVDGARPGDVPRGEGADVVPDRGGGKVSGMHSCCDASVGGRRGAGASQPGDGASDRTRGWVLRRYLFEYSVSPRVQFVKISEGFEAAAGRDKKTHLTFENLDAKGVDPVETKG